MPNLAIHPTAFATLQRRVLAPFTHLSSKLMNHDEAINLLHKISEKLSNNFNMVISEFGVEKGLMLDLKISNDNIKFREF
jgi:hypothetical protein